MTTLLDGDRSAPDLGSEQRLPRGALTYVRVRSLIELVAGAAVLGAGAALIPEPMWRVVAIAVLCGLTVIGLAIELPIIDRLRGERLSFSVRPDVITLSRGAVFRRVTIIPTRQVLNVEITEGPLLRHAGFVVVRFTSITVTPSLGPITRRTAQRIREIVLSPDPSPDVS